MRHYQPDSANAVARILSLALLADGALDKSEIDWLSRTKVLDRLGIQPATFDQVLQDFYEDVMVCTDYFDAMHFRLSSETVDALLDEVVDPDCQDAMLSIMFDVTAVDGTLSEGEFDLLARAVERWGREGRWPVRLTKTCPQTTAGAA